MARRKPFNMVLLGLAGKGKSSLLDSVIIGDLPSYRVPLDLVQGENHFFLLPAAVDMAAVLGSIAKVIWTLWRDRPERVWYLLSKWTGSRSSPMLEDAAQTILHMGVHEGHLDRTSVIEKLRASLAKDSESRLFAARFLPEFLLAMPAQDLTSVLKDWAADTSLSLAEVMGGLFALKPARCLPVFVQWARAEHGRLDPLLVECFRKIEVPPLDTLAEFRDLEAALRNLRLSVATRTPALTMELGRLLKKIHRGMSARAGQLSRRPDHRPINPNGPGRSAHRRRILRPHREPG
jgi:hypothetical protein